MEIKEIQSGDEFTNAIKDGVTLLSDVVAKDGTGTLTASSAFLIIFASILRRRVLSDIISIDVQKLEGKELLIIEVPSGKDIPFSYNNDIYVRQRAMTQKASVNTIKDMVLRKQVEPERWERRFSDQFELSDLSKREFKKLVSVFYKSNEFFDNPDYDEFTLLHKASLAKYGRITNAGDLLLAKNPE